MKAKRHKLYGIIFRSRVGNRIIGELWNFAGFGEHNEIIFENKRTGEFFKIPESEKRNYLIWEI